VTVKRALTEVKETSNNLEREREADIGRMADGDSQPAKTKLPETVPG